MFARVCQYPHRRHAYGHTTMARRTVRRTVGRLTSKQVANAKPGPLLADGGNLYLQASAGREGAVRRSWVFKYELDGDRHAMGLGPLHTVGLAEARQRARNLRLQLLDGIDPLGAKRKDR